jgi:hypothetical protein
LLLIFSLVQWRRFVAQEIEVALYIARDARVMLDVYDAIADLLPGSCPRRYIRLSRRAVALVHPDDLCQHVRPVATKVGRKTVAEWLNNFTLDDGLRQRILAEAGLSESTPFTQISKHALRQACQIHLAAIEKAQRDLRTKVRDYLWQQAGTKAVRRIGIVDSGWACTIQDTLRGVCKEAEVISGVYFGVSRQGHEPTADNQKHGLLRDDFRNQPHHNAVEASAGVVRVWDTLLREPVGSVQRLERNAEGRVEPVLDDAPATGRLEREAIQAIRHGILEGTRARRRGVALLVKLCDHFSDRDFEMAATTIAGNISTYPTRRMADAILRLRLDEGAAKGRVGSLGLSALKHGVAWYPGLLAHYGLGWSTPLLKALATVLRWQKNLSVPQKAVHVDEDCLDQSWRLFVRRSRSRCRATCRRTAFPGLFPGAISRGYQVIHLWPDRTCGPFDARSGSPLVPWGNTTHAQSRVGCRPRGQNRGVGVHGQ